MKRPGRKTQIRKPKSSKRNIGSQGSYAGDDFVLTKAQLRELDRRVADMKDPVRYLIESSFSPRFRLFYNVSDDVYAMNNPAGATLFKRRKAALAVQKLLGGGARIVRCRTRRRNGQVIPVLASGKRPTKNPAARGEK